jgi:hypothetical protein
MDRYSNLVFRSSAARQTKAEAVKHRRGQQPLPLDPSCRICSALAPAAQAQEFKPAFSHRHLLPASLPLLHWFYRIRP